MRADSTNEVSQCKAPPLDQIGIVRHVHSRGFGFAECLTGDRTREVFLNESRIGQLKAVGTQPQGRLIRMRLVQQYDGRWAAARVSPLIATATDTLKLAREHLARARKQELRDTEAGPALLLQLLGNIDPDVDRLLRPLADALPTSDWCSPALLNVLMLAPPSAWHLAIEHHLKVGTPHTPEVLYHAITCGNKEYATKWLRPLWDGLPSQRSRLLPIAFARRARMSVAEAAHWACAAVDHDAKAAGEWWGVLGGSIIAGLPLESGLLAWPGWVFAPWGVAMLAIERCLPNSAQAIKLLDQVAAQSDNAGRMRAATVLACLDERDQRLADLWIPELGRDVEQSLRQALAAQMRTARAAEKCAAEYMQQLELDVEDIAMQQLEGNATDWRQMDLRIGGRHGVDVKNLRRSINGGIQASRWRVKNFKADASGTDVLLCGVSSPYTWISDGVLTCESTEEMRVLGVTTATEIQSLLRQFRKIFVLRTHSVSKLLELPAWAWDYPRAQYRQRDRAMSALREAFPTLETTAAGRRCLAAVPSAVLCFLGFPPVEEGLNPQQRDFLDLLRELWSQGREALQASPTPRLPWIYLFTLHAWARWRAANEAIDTRRLLALFKWHANSDDDAKIAWERATQARIELATQDSSRGDHRIPRLTGRSPSAVSGAGIVDPAAMLSTLLNSLAILENQLSRSQFISISDLTIHHNGVMVGTFSDGQRKTLLAHCGGRLQENNVECGHRPLVYGRQTTCACGRLICEKCESCIDDRYGRCEHQELRRIKREKGNAKVARNPPRT